MRPVKLITGVTVEEVLCDHMDSLRVVSFNPSTSSPCYMTKEVLNTPSRMHIIPIKHWKRSYYKTSKEADSYGKPFLKDDNLVEEEGYIAVSPELDETPGKYIRIIANECETAKLQEQNTKHFLELSQKNLELFTLILTMLVYGKGLSIYLLGE